ncbi:hypothetical protein [Ruminiclostridium papyrosolvens]|uniref:Uncharacterized protein n=1 Tax=Ruminiclostridium papyrosolvens C7 TaxID=1330534 RepID=U4R1H9_9FIRM|nr:hypothetical protein [Ruminiclostridium papyrosolvens]EPR12068.1 hypothetical protein L323_10100 [Ruminiclostridium papyrosolvens C7]
MEPIFKLTNPNQGIPVKASGSTAVGTPMAGEPDNSNPTGVPDNLQNGTSPDSSLVSGNTEKPEPRGTPRPSETIIKSDAPKKSSKEVGLKIDFSDNGLVQGFIMSEILARPKAMKRRGNTLWNSRF